ncbi:hypothetical protein CORC01_14384 [Colletotrichum orchidophilum]|uniref:Uncharacterized protein n=1 Tax=Colletotrichum orchidophilum TaxID=1209926 RepID=A0A1G4AMQ4_9PEZI|nr:uncharacterized protein CORC01_14384 [Colletotrichum orchidophilum]OHE90323.1 hypothetical protein CORC01_14384 [Colletotrichum orchidophilum]
MEMLQCALRVIRKRYPLASLQEAGEAIKEYPPREAGEQTEVPLHVTGEWIKLMGIVACSTNTTEQRVSSSLWLFARGDQAEVDVIAEYLGLLRLSYPSLRYSDPVMFTSDSTETAERLYGTLDATTLIPCNYDGAWFAAVSYADCVQLYGVQAGRSSELEQQVQGFFPGRTICFSEPLVTTSVEATGALMLLSLRMLAGGGVPTLCTDTAFLQNSRARIFIELLTGTLDAKDSDVSERLQQAQIEDSTFFDAAFIHEDSSPSPVGSTFTADIGNRVGSFAFGASPSSPRLFSPAGGKSPSTGRGSSETTHASPEAPHHPLLLSRAAGPSPKVTKLRSGLVFGTGMRGMSPPVPPPSPPPMSEECRMILNMLSEAVAFYRSSRSSGSTELAVMWSALKNGSKSEFYRRYIGLLFYKEMTRLGSDQEVALRLKTSITKRELREMRRHQSDFQIWHDICDLRHDWRSGRYALLCALPESFQAGRAYQDMSEPEFDAYLSLSPRPVIPISRWGPFILALTVRILQDEANEKKGIVQILRFVQVPDVVGSIATAVQSAAASVVTAAVASGESLVAASLPSSVSVGTKYACLASECAAIPGHAFRLLQDLAPLIPSPEGIGKLQELVDRCPNLETVLFAGLGLVLVSTTLLLAGLKFRLLRFVSLGLDGVAVVVFAVVAVFAVSLYQTSQAVADLLGVEASKGDVFGASIADFTYVIPVPQRIVPPTSSRCNSSHVISSSQVLSQVALRLYMISMSVRGVVSLNITIVFVSGLSGLAGRPLHDMRHLMRLNTDFCQSDVPDDPPMVISQQTLEETLSRLGIPPAKVRSESRSRGKLAALVGCDAAGSAVENPRDDNNVSNPLSRKTTTAGLQPVIDRINSSIQRLDHQLRALNDAQERLGKLAALTTEEVDWDDPVTRIRSEEALFDCESD